eukprot:TRINITY_DN5330_c0_g1_i1.p1 TRINITY_DN5330_c0_g1~~TRINITY_DN5330_c0_g1_i1.p1  ORF type:complete len:448 (+),score=102.20 TRINITY_DN5330_c0_g1_i1:170-1345(+)
MNLSLLDPFASDFPEMIEDCLDDGTALTCSFNRRGTLLAVGCHDGRVVVWDFDTRSPTRNLTGHVFPVSSVSWSRNGRRLLSSSADCTLFYWDVVQGTMETTIKFETPVNFAQMHPKDPTLCIACPHYLPPVLVNLKTGEKRPIIQSMEQKTNVVATFSKKGDFIYTADSKGNISVISVSTLQITRTFKVAGGATVKALEISSNGKFLLVNSTDKIVRLYDAETHVLKNEFQDVVSKMQWKKCCLSYNGDYVIGGSAQKSQHNIYIWSQQGQLVKMLEGPKEGIMDLVWHPQRPIIASCSTQGVIYVWATNYQENWSAFAPDFKELEENEEYVEREDEFDVVDEEEEKKKKVEQEEEDEVDIMTVDKIATFSSDEEDDLFYLPTVPEPDPK